MRRPGKVGGFVAGLAILLACVLLGGCASKTVTVTSGGPGSPTRTAGTPSSTTTANGDPTPVATALDKSAGGGTWQVSVYSILRRGNHVILYFGVKCLTPNATLPNEAALTGCGTDSFTQPGGSGSDQDGHMNGVRLVDTVHQRVYEVFTKTHDGSISDPTFTSTFPVDGDAGQNKKPRLEWAAFSAPPASTTTMDVAFPDGGPVLTSVPVTSGSAPRPGKDMVVDGDQGAGESLAALSSQHVATDFPVKLTVANPYASDQETPSRSLLTLHSDVLFAFGKATLDPSAKRVLASVASTVKNRASGVVHVDGYTDSKGSPRVNGPLSQRRAATVEKALKPQTPGVSYAVAGHGAADPVAPNTNSDGSDNPKGRAENRRVTVTFRPKPGSKAQALSGAAARKAQTSATAMTFPSGTPNAPKDTWTTSNASLTRDGGFAVLRMTVKCVKPAPGSDGDGTCDLGYGLTGDDSTPPQVNGLGQPACYVSGFYLEDPTSGDVYDPAWPIGSAVQQPVLTADLYQGGSLGQGQQYQVWSYFPAIPASVSHVTLFAPLGKGKMTVPVTG